jgi:sulfur transfer complex TusBCD TusB component (DsrH family)
MLHLPSAKLLLSAHTQWKEVLSVLLYTVCIVHSAKKYWQYFFVQCVWFTVQRSTVSTTLHSVYVSQCKEVLSVLLCTVCMVHSAKKYCQYYFAQCVWFTVQRSTVSATLHCVYGSRCKEVLSVLLCTVCMVHSAKKYCQYYYFAQCVWFTVQRSTVSTTLHCVYGSLCKEVLTVLLCTVNHTHTHTRSEYAAIKLTTYVPTRIVEQDL